MKQIVPGPRASSARGYKSKKMGLQKELDKRAVCAVISEYREITEMSELTKTTQTTRGQVGAK